MPPSAEIPAELSGLAGYQILKELGRGGMGVVYLARNELMDRPEVLKVMSKDRVGQPEAVERFLQEIRSAARLSHHNVATAYSAYKLGDLLVLAMEFVDGVDLAKTVRENGPMSVASACYSVYQAAVGLQSAHELGLVHRDIKPSNLLLSVQGKRRTIKIVDFGLAKAKTEVRVDHELTNTNQMMGTPGYTAPEQLKDAKNADIRADVYSLGCTLYYLLAGGPAFRGGSAYEVLLRQEAGVSAPIDEVRSGLPNGLREVIERMMAKDPARRYPTPADVARALLPFIKTAGSETNTEPPPKPIPEGESQKDTKSGNTLTGSGKPPQGPADQLLIIACSECNTALKLPSSLLGKKVKCKNCGAKLTADLSMQRSPLPTGDADQQAPISVTSAESMAPVTGFTLNSETGSRSSGYTRTAVPIAVPVDDGGSLSKSLTAIAVPSVPAPPPVQRASRAPWIVAAVVVAIGGVAIALVALLNKPTPAPASGEVSTSSDTANKDEAGKTKEATTASQSISGATKKTLSASTPVARTNVEEIRKDLESGDRDRCLKALEDAAALPTEKVALLTDALFNATEHLSDGQVSVLAIEQLKRINSASPNGNVKLLTSALRCRNSEVAKYAVHALGQTGQPQAIEILAEKLRDGTSPLRIEIVTTLSHLGIRSPPIFAALLVAANDTDQALSEDALKTLNGMRPYSIANVDALKTVLGRDNRTELRVFAVRALESLGNQGSAAVPKLREMLVTDRDSNPEMAKLAIQAIVAIRDKHEGTIADLCALAFPGSAERAPESLRQAAISALNQLDPSKLSIEKLARACESSPNGPLAAAIAEILDQRIERLDSSQISQLKPLLRNGSLSMSVRALSAVVRKASISGLEDEVAELAVSRDNTTRERARQVFQRLGAAAKPVVPSLLKRFKDFPKELPNDQRLELAYIIASIDSKSSDVADAIIPVLMEGLQWEHDKEPDLKLRQKIAAIIDSYGQAAIDVMFRVFDKLKYTGGTDGEEYRIVLYDILDRVGKRYKSAENCKLARTQWEREKKHQRAATAVRQVLLDMEP